MNRSIVIVDIDHVIADAAWRDHLIPDWDAYHSVADNDALIEDIAHLLNALDNFGYTIIGLTGRPEKWRSLTLEWLVRHQVRMDDLIMRPDRDYRPSPEMKLHRFQERYPLTDIAFVLDDRDDICAAFHAAGVTVLQVRGRQK